MFVCFFPDSLYLDSPPNNSSSNFRRPSVCVARFLSQLWLTMSQLQFQCPSSPMSAAPAPVQLTQPGYSIPCASGTLPSESASQPIRSSALPAGSVTPYNTTTSTTIGLLVLYKTLILYFTPNF